MKKCEWPDGVAIRPNGADELDPCVYDTVEETAMPISGYRFRLLRCVNCGHEEIEWARPGAAF